MDQETGVSRARVGTASSPARSESGRSISELRQDIAQTRSEITDTVDLLSEKLKQTIDWRAYVSEYPFLAVGGAAILGFYLTRKLLGPKRSTTEELLQNLIRTASEALRPKRNLTLTLLSLAGKYALDSFQKYRQEQEQQQQLQEQLEELHALQILQQQHLTGS